MEVVPGTIRMQSAMKGISAVVATYKRKNELIRLFESMIRNNITELEVIVVDQNRDGLLDDLIADYKDKLDLVHHKMEEANQSKARNLGASIAKYPVVCFPDDDCWFEDDSLRKVIAYFDKKPSTDLLVINWKQNPMNYSRSPVVKPREVYSLRSVGYVTYVLFFNKATFNSLGGFLETIGIGKYIGGGEDSELTFRAAKHRMNIFFDADINVHHKYVPIHTRDLSTIRARQRGLGLMYAIYPVPGHVIFKGFIAPLVKMALCMNVRKAREHLNVFLGRKEGYFYGLRKTSLVAIAGNQKNSGK